MFLQRGFTSGGSFPRVAHIILFFYFRFCFVCFQKRSKLSNLSHSLATHVLCLTQSIMEISWPLIESLLFYEISLQKDFPEGTDHKTPQLKSQTWWKLKEMAGVSLFRFCKMLPRSSSWLPCLPLSCSTTQYIHHRCSSSQDSLRGIHPSTPSIHSHFLLGSSSDVSNSVKNIYMYMYMQTCQCYSMHLCWYL